MTEQVTPMALRQLDANLMFSMPSSSFYGLRARMSSQGIKVRIEYIKVQQACRVDSSVE